jgi:hypothetical protein
MIKLTPSEVTALKELAAAGPRGRKSRAVRSDLARLIRAHYVTEQSASMDTVVYHGPWPSCPGELKGEGKVFLRPRLRARPARRRYNAILSLPLSSLGT